MTSGYPINGSPLIHYMIIFQKQSLDIFAGAVAQLVVVPVMQVDLEVVADFASSQRAAGGFGH